jgi:hypothetical protein
MQKWIKPCCEASSKFRHGWHTIPLWCEPAAHGDPAADWERLHEEARSPCAGILVELHHLQRAAVNGGLVQRDVPLCILLICNSASGITLPGLAISKQAFGQFPMLPCTKDNLYAYLLDYVIVDLVLRC